jgi:hypothetical protein
MVEFNHSFFEMSALQLLSQLRIIDLLNITGGEVVEKAQAECLFPLTKADGFPLQAEYHIPSPNTSPYDAFTEKRIAKSR